MPYMEFGILKRYFIPNNEIIKQSQIKISFDWVKSSIALWNPDMCAKAISLSKNNYQCGWSIKMEFPWVSLSFVLQSPGSIIQLSKNNSAYKPQCA